MELTREDNITTAADPQAITTAHPRKEPLSDNDPTRNVSSREGIQRELLIGLVALALLVMLLATIGVFVG